MSFCPMKIQRRIFATRTNTIGCSATLKATVGTGSDCDGIAATCDRLSTRLSARLAKLTAAIAGMGMLAAMACMPAQAETYITIDGSSVTLENEADEGLSTGGMRFRLGTQVSEVFDIEGHFGFSFSDDTESYDELTAAYLGAYLKGYVPVGHHSALFGLAGWTNVSLSQEVGQGEFTEERAGFSWGFGMETQLTRNLDLTADYMSYLRSDGIFEDVSAVSIGLKLYF